jgi:hypothetical protein
VVYAPPNIKALFGKLTGDETIALAGIEPLDRTDDAFRHFILLLIAKRKIVCQACSIGWSYTMAQGAEPWAIVFPSNVNLLASYSGYNTAVIRISQV